MWNKIESNSSIAMMAADNGITQTGKDKTPGNNIYVGEKGKSRNRFFEGQAAPALLSEAGRRLSCRDLKYRHLYGVFLTTNGV